MTDQTTRLPIRRALISVSDKTGILEFARELEALGVEILSTGGTFKLLQDNGVAAVEVADYTGSVAIIDACRPYHWIDEFPATTQIAEELLKETNAKWGKALGED